MINHNIGQINIRSLKCNLDILRESVNRNKLDIIILQETWLKDESFVFAKDFNLEIKNREDSYGSVAIAIKSNLIYERIQISDLNPIEIIIIKIKLPSISIHVASIYIPSNISNSSLENKLDALNNIISNFPNLLLAGDFNTSHGVWEKNYRTSTRRGDIILNFINDNNLIVLNTGEATNVHYRKLSAIDVSLITTSLINVWDWHVLDEDCGSNHKLVIMKPKQNDNIDYKIKLFNKRKTIEDINKLNFEKYNTLEDCLKDCKDCVNSNISFKTNNKRKQINRWWSAEIKEQHEKKSYCLKLLNRS